MRSCIPVASLAVALIAACFPGFAAAQAWPARPVKLIVPLGAGGASDVVARVVAAKLGERIGQQVVVENRPGAEGMIGMEAAAKSAPDGYTLAMGSSTTMAANFALRRKLPFHPFNDFAPVAMMVKNAFNILVIHPGVPAQNLQEFIALARAQPGKLFYGSATLGSKICAEQFRTMAGVNIAMINYKSTPQALADLMSGQLQLVCEPMGTAIGLINSGKVRALGVTSPERVALAPHLPTVAEAGLPGFEYSAWVGIFAPAGTPAQVIARIGTELVAVQGDPDTVAKIRTAGFDPMIGGPAELTALLRTEIERTVKVAKDAGIEPE